MTLIEMLMVMAMLGLLFGLLAPTLQRARQAGESGACRSNLRQVSLAHTLYLDDHEGLFFPWREQTPEGTLWYWGLEVGGGSEGGRRIIRERGRLAPYLAAVGGVETCPALPYEATWFKQKFELATFGYGININMLDGAGGRDRGIRRMSQLSSPAETIAWADAAQVNTWQAPASAANPMMEEWYYLNSQQPPKFHFRHGGHCHAAFADGSIRALEPDRLDPRCDGLTGFIEPRGEDFYLRLTK
jgi:prepilin-type processing-associated H-X9-DG protein